MRQTPYVMRVRIEAAKGHLQMETEFYSIADERTATIRIVGVSHVVMLLHISRPHCVCVCGSARTDIGLRPR